MTTIKEVLEKIKIELAKDLGLKKGKIEIKLNEKLFISFAKYIQFCIKYKNDEPYRKEDCSSWIGYTVKVNGKTVWIYKLKV